MEHTIEVKIEDGKVVTAAEDNPKAGVNRGDTVIWSFEGNVAEQKLEVRPKGAASSFNASPKPNQISGQIFPNASISGEDSFEYDIIQNGKTLEWADGSRGGCAKPIGG